jgi:(heptosyl)LPS beta-1,4-glucosyltransferase
MLERKRISELGAVFIYFMATISVVISAWNEEAKIKQCLESLDWVDEIIVVDNSSTDTTGEIAGHYKAKVYIQPNNQC